MSERKFVRTDTFDKAYHKLDGTVQKLVIAFLHTLQLNPNANSLNLKQPQAARDRRVRTARVNDNFRAVLLRDGETFYLVTVLEHDKAYKLAEGLTMDINKVTGGIELLDLSGLEESTRNSASGAPLVGPDAMPGLFDGVSDADLVRLGVNEVLIPALRELRTEDALLGVCEFLPKLARDVLLSLYDGKCPEEIWQKVTAPEQPDTPLTDAERGDYEAALTRPATLETFVVSSDAQELERNLLRPFSEWRIFLHPEQRKLAYRPKNKPYNGPVRVTGGPGTGKTVVALHRVAALADPQRGEGRGRILLTTFTTTLADQLERLLKDLGGQELASAVTVRNIDKVATSVARHPSATVPAMLGDLELLKRWRDLLTEQAEPGRFDSRFLLGEWTQVVLAQGLQTRDDYFAARRRGRGLRINRADRAEIWALIEEYERRLEQDQAVGFKQLAATAARIAEAGLEPRQQYAHIVVDEAQDLHAAHWRLLRALAPEGPNDLFVCGDTHQRIYDNRVTLGSLGIDIRGRSHKLSLNYRTTRQILAAAGDLLDREQFDDLDGGADDLAGYRSVLSGREAELTGYPSVRAEMSALVNRVAGWKEAGILPQDIAVVARTGALCDAALDALQSSGTGAIRVDAGKAPRVGDYVHVMTMHRTKGLEYRAVAVIGVSDQCVPQPAALTDAAADPLQHAQDLRAERSLLFVAATRAREALAITWHGRPSPFLVHRARAQ
ncbi:3'-5' exonuclease [Kutzneria viridogrisea]|uniref:DNA 3'-5' helicase n=1 Tax=Kutzneria viridogrisea TaxID=47990 RepID=A0ABR6BIW5_9PSEU|nr:superfamily I DNA/RNA helicase/mRNA-degrading endonuclease RelE of RelBE toxin-antitoxin system [Kutzneria viridogrisea]